MIRYRANRISETAVMSLLSHLIRRAQSVAPGFRYGEAEETLCQPATPATSPASHLDRWQWWGAAPPAAPPASPPPAPQAAPQAAPPPAPKDPSISLAASLCGGLTDNTITSESFRGSQLNYAELVAWLGEGGRLDDPDFVLHLQGSGYLSWTAAQPAIFCLLFFLRPVPEQERGRARGRRSRRGQCSSSATRLHSTVALNSNL